MTAPSINLPVPVFNELRTEGRPCQRDAKTPLRPVVISTKIDFWNSDQLEAE